MNLFVRSQASERRVTPNERRTMHSERRTMHSERRIRYDHKRGSQPDDTRRIPSWHASHHPSLSVTSSSRSWHASHHSSLFLDYSVTSRIPFSGHASDHSSTSPVIYHNCHCSSTCPVRGSSASRPADQPLSQTLNTEPLSQTYGTPSDQLRRAEHHHRGSTFSFHDGRLSSHNAYQLPSADDYHVSTCRGSCLSSSTTYSPPPYRASRPEFTYHISSRDRRWQAVLQDTIRRLIRSLGMCSARAPGKRAFKDIARQAAKLLKLDLAKRGSVLGGSRNSSTAGDSGATMLEGATAGENAMERSVPSFLPSFLSSYPRRNTYADPRVWLASEGGDRIGDAGSLREDAGGLREDAGGLVDNDHAGGIGEDAGALKSGGVGPLRAFAWRLPYYVAGDALNFDDPCGFENYAGGSVNDDPSSLNDYSGFLNDDDNTSTISLLNGEPLADADLGISLHLSSSSTPYSHSSSRIEVWIAGVAESRRGAREDSSESPRFFIGLQWRDNGGTGNE
ncbi:hypothetical protein EV121DRAFT_282888 [Schizophyllum commune]